MARLQASVQYGDWSGTAAADDAGNNDLNATLKDQGLVPAGKFLVGFDFWLSESTGEVSFKAYFVEGESHEEATGKLPASGPIDVTVVDVPMSLQQFLKCFKRFNVKATRKGMGLEGREFSDD